MRSRHLLDPDLAPFYDNMPSATLSMETLGEMRVMMDAMVTQVYGRNLDGLSLTERHVPGAPGDPDVRVLILQPEGDAPAPRPAILETHGGGHVLGTADTSVSIYADLVRELQVVMVLVDYRLSPETPAPGPLEDCYAALKWLHDNAETLGVDRQRIAVTGASAGGTLAAGVAMLARDRDDGIAISHLHLLQPMLDDRTCTDADLSPFIGEYGWTREQNMFGWSCRLGTQPGSDGVSPYIAPGRMEDVSGLPPTFISCGALDLFVEEDIAFARRLIRAGVPVELHIYPGAPHGAPLKASGPLSDAMNRDDVNAWKRAFGLLQGAPVTP